MPRSIDLTPQNLQIDHNPNHKIGMSAGQAQNFLDNRPALVAAALIQAINQMLSDIDSATGLDLLKWAQLIENWLDGDTSSSGGSDLLSRLTDRLKGIDFDASQAWQNWVTALQDMDANTVALIKKWIADVLVPAGGLASGATIPSHLFTHLGPSVLENLLPDGSFDDPTVFDGESIWSYDASVDHTGTAGSGSAMVVADGTFKQLESAIPIECRSGQTLHLSGFPRWDSAPSAGGSVQLSINAYDKSGALIADSANRVVDGVTVTSGNSSSVGSIVDTQGNTLTPDVGWVPLAGSYSTPTNTWYVVVCAEVTADVAAGTVIHFDDLILWCPVIDSVLLGNLENHPVLGADRVRGSGGLADLETTWLTNWGKLITALGGDSTDLSRLAQLLNSWAGLASDAHGKALTSENLLAIVNNQPVSAGLEATVVANGTINNMTVMAPNVSQSSGSAGATLNVNQAKTFTFVQWFGKMVTAFTSPTTQFVINFYKLNPATGNMDLLFSSPDLSTTLSTSLGWNLYNLPLGDAITANAGDALGVGFQIIGTSHSYQFFGWNTAVGTTHPTAEAKHLGFSQNWGASTATSIAAASIGWGVLQSSGTFSVPYVGLGVGTLPATVLPPLLMTATTVGSFTSMVDQYGTTHSTVPAGYLFADLIALGGGGGGGGGSFGAGFAGSSSSLTVGTHTVTSTGGARGAAGKQWFQAASYGAGVSPSELDVSGLQFFGGDQAGTNQTGSAPGGGGGGGTLLGFYGNGGGAASWADSVGVSLTGGESISGAVGAGGAANASYGAPGAPGAVYLYLRQS